MFLHEKPTITIDSRCFHLLLLLILSKHLKCRLGPHVSNVTLFQSCLERQINEAVRISSNTADHILNSKSEFHQAPIVRLVTTNGLQTEQGEEEVVVRGRGGGRRAERGQ